MKYDIIIIGAGPGGYVAAERAGAFGKKVLVVERGQLGGVCLNEGCIPTKTLLNSAKLYRHALDSEKFGVTSSGVRFDLDAVMAHKNEVMDSLRNGIASLLKKFKVDVVAGSARFLSARQVEVNGVLYDGESIVIASGSSPVIPPIPGIKDNPHVATSSEILAIEALPKSLVVVGGGVIGIEFASFFSSLGVAVDVIEMMGEIIPFMDSDCARALRESMSRVNFHLNAKVESVSGRSVAFSQNGKSESIEADIILMSVGRKPNVVGLGFETFGLDFDAKGIKVNDRLQTNVPGVYAIGDVTGSWQLAHVASRMGEVAVNTICGKPDRMRYHAVPWAVYGIPEAAGAGATEDDLKRRMIPYKKATVRLRNNGRFIAENEIAEPGLCKVLVHSETGVLLGVHLLGGACSEMIFGAAAMIEAELRDREIREIIFPHPTVSESIRDAIFELK